MRGFTGLLVVGALLTTVRQSTACTCKVAKPPQETMAAADAVFRGVVVAE
jgi:hypothetical protein